MCRSINYSSWQREEKIIRSFIAKCRANSLCWAIYEESARAQLTREHERSARRSRKPRGTAAFPVCTARRSSLKICQPHGRQKHVFFSSFFFCRATSQRARAKNSDVFSHNTSRYTCFHLFSSWNNQGHREIIMQITAMLADIPAVGGSTGPFLALLFFSLYVCSLISPIFALSHIRIHMIQCWTFLLILTFSDDHVDMSYLHMKHMYVYYFRSRFFSRTVSIDNSL